MSILSKLRISQRLALSFMVILLLLAMISIVAVSQMKKQSVMAQDFVTNDVEKFIEISMIKSHAQRSALLLLQIMPTEVREQRIALYKEMDKENIQLNKVIKTVGDRFNGNAPMQFSDITSSQLAYNESFVETVEYVEFDIETALEHYQESTRPALETLLMSISKYLESEQHRMFLHQKENKLASDDVQVIVIFIGIVAFVLSTLLAFSVSRSIIKPLNETIDLAEKIAMGDLKPTNFKSRKDEVGLLMNAIENMRLNLSELISSIKESSSSIASSAHVLNTPVKDVHNGSIEQIAAVDNIASVVYEFSLESAESAETAQQAKNQSLSARDLASQGKDMIEKATSEFATISITISDSAEAVQGVHNRAKAVRDLITMISQIADQTNLLALNAAIEAARAGESGRGFSVVADEVRALAGRTAKATIEINQVIDGIDSETNNAVERITAGQSELEQGVDILQQMVTPLVDLNIGAQESLTSLEKLEVSIANQAHESSQIESSVKNIGEQANTNQNSIDDVTATTMMLCDMAESLSNKVSKFTLS